MDKLNIYLPFIFSEKIDPRKTFTVGDQVVSEHIFAYHYSASLDKTNLPLFSETHIDEKLKKITFKVVRDVRDFSGKKLSIEDICLAMQTSFEGTHHTNYSSLIRSVSHDDNRIVVEMIEIPRNIEYWLRSTDFAIYKLENLPLDKKSLKGTTGPYFIKSFDSKEVHLERNPFFPKELLSNVIKNVSLVSYSQNEIIDILSNSYLNDIWYLYGYAIDEMILEKFKEKNYKVQMFPNEWLVYIGFQENLNLEERKFISSKIDKIRNIIKTQLIECQLAYSLSPADQPHGLSKSEYDRIKDDGNLKEIKKKIRFATLEDWFSMPLFKFIFEALGNEIDIELKLYSRNELKKVYSKEEADFYLAPMGISLADPLGNYSFLYSNSLLFQEPDNMKKIIVLYKEKSLESFEVGVKKIETEMLDKRVIVPIGHFPGLVIESPLLIKDETRSWDWGIQAWAYKEI